MPVIVFRPRIILLITFLALATTSVFALHKFYFGTSNISVNQVNKSLECQLQFFRDDFEEALQERSQQKVSLTEHFTDTVFGLLVQEYVLEGFAIVQEGAELEETYIGYESDDEFVHVFVEIRPPSTGAFIVKNSCLMELFEDQKNVVNFQLKRGGQTQSRLITRTDKEASFEMP